ncbi:gp57 domain protein [Mycobacterium xenopi 4042]|uniref:Gp57 domain protein n=1 Tax=Mycobacterium xenopi 4042 TaxID=1299334 RepID=X8BGC4_MYCXE|nr:gp57 domain protein [Mycobacterium xenopi 4042]
MDLDRITHPLRLAKGSHRPGSGKGCAMNVISYVNGETEITDFPTCSADRSPSSFKPVTTCWPGPMATCHPRTACWLSNWPGRPWEPPMCPTP